MSRIVEIEGIGLVYVEKLLSMGVKTTTDLLKYCSTKKGRQEAIWVIGPIHLAVGSFLAVLIDFLVIALVVFILMKQLKKTPLA